MLESSSSSWLFLVGKVRDSTQLRRARKSFFGPDEMSTAMSSIVGGRRHAWRGMKSTIQGIVVWSCLGSSLSSLESGLAVDSLVVVDLLLVPIAVATEGGSVEVGVECLF